MSLWTAAIVVSLVLRVISISLGWKAMKMMWTWVWDDDGVLEWPFWRLFIGSLVSGLMAMALTDALD